MHIVNNRLAVELDPVGGGNRDDLINDPQRELPGFGGVDQHAAAQPADRGDAVGGGVDRNLGPDGGHDVRGDRAMQAGRLKPAADVLQEGGFPARGGHDPGVALADRADVAGLNQIAGEVADADDDPLHRDILGNQLEVAQTVLQGHHHSIRADKGLRALQRGAGIDRLGEEDDQIRRKIHLGGQSCRHLCGVNPVDQL